MTAQEQAQACGHEHSVGGIAYTCERGPHPADGRGPASRHAARIDFEQAEGTDAGDGFGEADLMTWLGDSPDDGEDPEVAWGTVAGYGNEAHAVTAPETGQPGAAADPFGGHEFAYEGHTDLFRCIRCHAYEVTVRDGEDLKPCAGQPPAGSGPIEVNAW